MWIERQLGRSSRSSNKKVIELERRLDFHTNTLIYGCPFGNRLVSHIKSIILNVFAFQSRILFGLLGLRASENTSHCSRRVFFLTASRLMSRYTIGENCINFLLPEKSRVYIWPQTFQAFHFRALDPLKYLIWHVYMIPAVIVFRAHSNVWN